MLKEFVGDLILLNYLGISKERETLKYYNN
jgi:hypothetical protein